ncbi:hypothetical protein ACFRK5_37635 [Streptomyces niveus]|uniref:hypothetical protein n=1 Tax=Streptomyces niveus TaxID=193462 RepID=UPI0036A78EE0
MTAPTVTAGSLRTGCAAALRGGSQAASAIIAELRGEEADDSPRERVPTGRPAAYVEEGIVRSTVGSPRQASRGSGLIPHIPGFH